MARKRRRGRRHGAAPVLLLALSFNILGDGLRDCLDPKLKT